MPKRILSVAVAASMVMVGALPAFAQEVVEEDAEATNFTYFDDEHILAYSVDGDCTLTDGMTIEFTEDEDGNIIFEVGTSEETASGGFGDVVVVEEVVEPLDGCALISVEGPNGQVNHGTVVSSLVKALKAMDDLEGPLGQALKAAKADIGDLGKDGTKVKTSDAKDADADVDLDVEDRAKSAKPEKADNPNKGKGKNK